MAYIHCRACGWEQDDFWCGSYNPIRYLLNFEDGLLEKPLDEQYTKNCNFLAARGALTRREVLAQGLEHAAKNIRDMKWRTFQEFKDGDKCCPKCGEELSDANID